MAGFAPWWARWRRLARLLLAVAAVGSAVAQGQSVEARAQAFEPGFAESGIATILSHGPWPPAPRRDPTNRLSGDSAAIELGRELFFDPGLSRDGGIACSSCHDPARGFTDGLPRAVGLARHDRNTQGLLDVGQQRWDGGADSLWAASLRPLLSPIEMGADATTVAAHLRKRPSTAAPIAASTAAPAATSIGPPITAIDDETLLVIAAKSIAAWLETLVSPRTAFDDFRDALARGDHAAMQAYPAQARRGLAIFAGRGNCSICHAGAAFTNGEFHDVGRPFLVERGLVATAPYMHDGSLATLRDVVRHYSELDLDRLHADGETLLRPLKLSEPEIDDLVAFLRTLSAPEPSVTRGDRR